MSHGPDNQRREQCGCEECLQTDANERVAELEAELAALKEVGPCGKHPKSSWIVTGTAEDIFTGSCTDCQRERLIEAAAYRKAAETFNRRCNELIDGAKAYPAGDPLKERRESAIGELQMGAKTILGLISPTDLLALDEFEKQVKERALKAIRSEFYGETDNGDTEGWHCKDYMAAVERALKEGSK